MQAYSDNQADVNGEWVSSATLHKLSGDKEGTGKERKRNGEGGRAAGLFGGAQPAPAVPLLGEPSPFARPVPSLPLNSSLTHPPLLILPVPTRIGSM